MGGPHDPAKAWGAGHQLPQSRSPLGGDCLGRPGYSARAARVADAPSSHADPLPAPPVPPLRSAQPAGALPGAVCRRPMPPAHALAPRDRREGLSRGLGELGAGRGRHGAPGKGAGKGAPSRSPSLAGIEGSGLREETSPELRRGELKERRGGGEDGGGKNRSWSPSRSGRQDRSPCPPPPSPRAPPARPAVSPRAPPHSPARSLTPPLSLRLSVSGLVSAHLHACPGIARTAGIFRSLKSRKALSPSTSRGTQPLSLPQPPPPPSQNNTAALGRSGEHNNNLEGSALYESERSGLSRLPV